MSEAYTRFISGVKEHESPASLEEHRRRIRQDLADGLTEINCNVSESEALGLAVGHDHEEYVDFFLARSPVEALKTAGFSCSHLARAVESDRPHLVRKLLRHTLRLQPAGKRGRGLALAAKDCFKSRKTRRAMMGYLDKPAGCMVFGPSKTAVHIACETGRARCLAELLQHGAQPAPRDCDGFTPLDHTLRRLCTDAKGASPSDAALALEELLPYLPVVRASSEISELVREKVKQDASEPAETREVLQWISREMRTPRSLQQICKHQIRSAIGQSGGRPIPDGIFQLPLPPLIQQYLFAVI